MDITKTLVVAEKPSVARDIARVLKASGRGEGCITSDKYIVTWALGHLVSFMEPDEINPEYKHWRDCDLPIVPDDIPLKALTHAKAQFAIVKKLMTSKDVSRIVCATDAGREGELIFRFMYEFAKCKKPVDRLWISSMTDAAIREGFANLAPSSKYDALYGSARCRAEADWLVGMNASRAFSIRHNARLSLGRVQTPTLALLAKRADDIDNFKPRKYWVVTADFGDYSGVYHDKDNNSQLDSAQKANEIADDVRCKQATVSDVKHETKTEPPPKLYDLTTLQRDCNRIFGLTAKQTLDVLQALYEKHKLVTYPRTDSRHLPDDMRGKVKNALASVPDEFQPAAQDILSREIPMTKRVFDASKVSDHHAIIPTGTKPSANLTSIERGVYGIIARSLVAAFMPDNKYSATTVTTTSEGHAFKTNGKTTLTKGWKAIFPEGKDEKPLPKLVIGDKRNVNDITVKEDTTKPPPQYTDATLLSAMENAGRLVDDEALREAMQGGGLGTPATRAAIIERLIDVGYAQRNGKSVAATKKGRDLIAVAPRVMTSPELTAKWEAALSAIADGSGSIDKFRAAARKLAHSVVQHARSQERSSAFAGDWDKKPVRAKPATKRKTTTGKTTTNKTTTGKTTTRRKTMG